jgi:ribosomal protein S18 acetylase RimI-like enzyme
MGLDRAALAGLRRLILARGTGQLTVDDLRRDDLGDLAWSGDPEHLRGVAAAIEWAADGPEDYLAARAPTGEPVAKIRIEYAIEDDVGVLSQLATIGELQGLGIATLLIETAESRIRGRGMAVAALGVEDDNPRARRLYERLGYQAFDRRPAAWRYEDDDGVLRLHETTLTMLRKRL